MTAYVHIGTEKTGTTTIQQFLLENYNLLLKQNMVYPKSFLKGNQHWWIADLACDVTLNKVDDFRKIILNGDYLSVINEINQHRDKRFIFSSEGICR
ncbi:hypothetical protein FQZ14_04785, partial [Campylobacter lari]|nr:hypothetical protein [Campylobacter lari]